MANATQHQRPDRARSTDPKDYQDVPQAVAVMAKQFPDGTIIPPHGHQRDQLLYAISGVMRLRTQDAAWIVPPDGAVYIPAGTSHSVSMHGDVDMRTLYIRQIAERQRPRSLCVVAVPGLLRELILALSEDEGPYDDNGRGGLIARLIEDELARAKAVSLHVHLPTDPRLHAVCAGLIADPSDRRTLEEWSETSGASPRTMARLFERELKMSFNQWRQRVRFQSAIEALSHGVQVSTVAEQHGYRSASAFSAAFRKAMGYAPSHMQSMAGQ